MILKPLPFLLVIGFFSFSATGALPPKKTVRIELGDRVIEGRVDQPKGKGPHPVFLVATGADGDTRNPFYEKLARVATGEGFLSFRLEWSYRGKGGAASADSKREAEELGIVVTEVLASRMMKDYAIDATKVALAAEGAAARVAMMPEAGVTAEKTKGMILMNPDCGKGGNFGSVYAPFLRLMIPRILIAARGGTCPMTEIYAAASGLGDSLDLITFAGNPRDLVLEVVRNWLRGLGWATAKASAPTKKPDAKKHALDAQTAGTHP